MDSSKSCDYSFKLCMAGDSGVGKSNLLSRFQRKSFRYAQRATIGLEFTSKVKKIDDKNVKFQIWDTCGQEEYKGITKAYFKGAAGILLVYDISNRESFLSLEKWYTEFREIAEESALILLVGNKCDLEKTRQVDLKEAMKFSEDRNIEYIETSALTLTNVDLAFETIFNEVYAVHGKDQTKNGSKVNSVRIERQRTMISLASVLNEGKKDKSDKKCC